MQRAVFSMCAEVSASGESWKSFTFLIHLVPISCTFDPNPFLRESQWGLASLAFFIRGQNALSVCLGYSFSTVVIFS